jgi:hypothetical protein
MKKEALEDISFQNPNANPSTVGIIHVYNAGSAISKMYYSADRDAGYREIPQSAVKAGTPDIPIERNIENVSEGDWYIALNNTGLQAQIAVVKAGKDAVVTFNLGGSSSPGIDESGNSSTGERTIITDKNGDIKIENNAKEGLNPFPSEDGYAGGNTNTGVLAIINMYKGSRISRIEIYNDKMMTQRVMRIQLLDKNTHPGRLLDFEQQIKVVLDSGIQDAGRGYYVKLWYGIASSGANADYQNYVAGTRGEMVYIYNGITTQLSFKAGSEISGLKVYNNSYFPSNTRNRVAGRVKLWNYITEGVSGNSGGVVVTAVYITNSSGRQDTAYRETNCWYGYTPAWDPASKGPHPIRTVPIGGPSVPYGQYYTSGDVSPGIYWVKVTKSSSESQYGSSVGYYKRFIVPEAVDTNLTFNGTNIKSTQVVFE